MIGCGTAGAAVAILLARAGWDVTIFERVAAPGPVGAGIILQPTGQAVLARLGLLDDVAARGERLERLYLRTARGRTLADLHYRAVDPAWSGLGIHRGALFEALFEVVRPLVRLHTGCAVTSLRRDGARVIAVTASGEHGPFDVVVAADGAASELRAEPARMYPWGALWFVGEDPDATFRGELYQVARGTRRLYGVLPTGTLGGARVVSLFWSLAARDHDAWRADFAGWKAEIRALDPRSEPVLAQIRTPEQVTFARYRDVRMRRWHAGRVVTIGDAAHATSPQLGQGANLALLDALALADALAEVPEIDAALAEYTRRRARHLRHYQRMTRLLTPLFQSRSRVLGLVRDLTFPIANALPPLRRHMVRTMAGVSRGLVARPLALPAAPLEYARRRMSPDAPKMSELPGLVEKGLAMVEERLLASNEARMYDSIKAQLTYMKKTIAAGERPSGDQLDKLLLGVYAARELETSDPDLAAVLFDVEYLFKRL